MLGDGTTGYLFLVLSPATMDTLSASVCIPPPKPASECPVGGDSTTAKQLEALRHGWEEAHAAFVEYRTMHGILRRQLLAAVGSIYVDQLRAPYTQFSAVTVLALLQHLVDCYAKIGARELEENELRMAAPWAPDAPFEVFVRQIQDGLAFAERGKEPISAARVVRLAYRVISCSGLFTDDCRRWRESLAHATAPVAPTWFNFLRHFRPGWMIIV